MLISILQNDLILEAENLAGDKNLNTVHQNNPAKPQGRPKNNVKLHIWDAGNLKEEANRTYSES